MNVLDEEGTRILKDAEKPMQIKVLIASIRGES